jgi:hypothetical protein
LVVGESNSKPLLLPEKSVLFPKVTDDLQLALIGSAGNTDQEELDRIEDSRHDQSLSPVKQPSSDFKKIQFSGHTGA